MKRQRSRVGNRLVRLLGAAVTLVLSAVALMPEPASATATNVSSNVSSNVATNFAAPLSVARVSDVAASTGCTRPVPFRPTRFFHSTKIDNTFLPLVPGTRFTYVGTANRGGGPTDHTVVFTVTNLVKFVNGVLTRVVLDLDSGDGQLQEAELAFFAQDKAGNVWSMGEYPEEYTDGVLDGAPNTWISGLAGAEAGIMMLADPKVGGPRYVQGFSPKIDFLDCAQVFKKGQRTCVPVACYNNVLVTDENSPLDPEGGHQRKFYAPGVGNVKITAVDDPEGETLSLTKLQHLNRSTLTAADNAALVLDRRGHRISKVYAFTPPAFVY
jgi:hypothetical protein